MLLFIFGVQGIAQAGPFTDEMSKCLVKNTSESDRTLFVQWVYAAMSSHPDVKAMSNVSPAIADDLNKRTANLVMELLTVRCKAETEQALKYEGASSFQASFSVLGSVAMQGLMSNPNVTQYLSGLNKYVDAEKLKSKLATK
jgi:hypothetical protein